MKPLARAYVVLSGFLVVGAIAAWHILWHVTSNNCGMATDGTEERYVGWVMLTGVVLGAVGGCWFALLARKRQFLYALLLSIVAIGIGFAVLGITRYVHYPLERYDAFSEWTEKHHLVWLDTMLFWTQYWIAEAVYYWLLPQTAAQTIVVALIQIVKSRR